jgi:6-phospho-3-hexuloisomerase
MTFQTRIAVILDELCRTLATPDDERVDRLVAAIRDARRIFVAGAGRSGLMMRAFGMRLMHLGFDVSVVGETVTPAITGKDLLLIGSGSGATASMVSHAETAKRFGATLAVITIQTDSPVGRLADVVLIIPAPTPKLKQNAGNRSVQPLGSLFEQCLLITLDAMALALMEKNGQRPEDLFTRHANLE